MEVKNVFVKLAMYWQLHLAYDLGGYNYKTFDTNKEQLENLIFARMDSYVRNMATAPYKDKDNKLSLDNANTDNKLMRLAVAAAGKDILEFFERWGLEPDEGTRTYASQFEKETRGIWFTNDEIRAWQLEHAGDRENLAKKAEITLTEELPAQTNGNEVTLNLSSNSDIWMYEIYRYELQQGITLDEEGNPIDDNKVRQPVGYVEADESGSAVFTDVIGTVNNRAFYYEVVGYDRWLNPTDVKLAGATKVCHDGSIDKKLWEVESNLTNSKLEEPNEVHPDTTEQPDQELMIDGNTETSFTGKSGTVTQESGSGSAETVPVDPEIVLNLNQEETITGLKYGISAAGSDVEVTVYVSTNGAGDWTQVNTAEPAADKTGSGMKVIYFNDGKNLYTYDASYVKLVLGENAELSGKDITISELDLLGQTGDNVELEAKDIGVLETDYVHMYDDGTSAKIPAGSLIFKGSYKGNPAYNAVMMWDGEGRLVAGTDGDGDAFAEQIIFAPAPEDGLLGEISEGFWVYYIDPGHMGGKDAQQFVTDMQSRQVRVELYRVDDAMTNAGQRLVSSTLFVEIPQNLSSVTLSD